MSRKGKTGMKINTSEYKTLRKQGYKPIAIANKIDLDRRWAQALAKGLVRQRWESDPDSGAFVDPDSVPSAQTRAQIEQLGLWGLICEYFDGREWDTYTAAIWSMIGNDDDGGYLDDLKLECLDQMDDYYANECCKHCNGAGVKNNE